MAAHDFRDKMKLVAFFLVVFCSMAASSYGAFNYDTSAYTQCEKQPAAPLYNGGMLVNPGFEDGTIGWTEIIGDTKLHVETENNGNKYIVASDRQMPYHSPSQKLENLGRDVKYALSAWVQIKGAAESVFVKAIVSMEDKTYLHAGNVIARNGCWSFLKGGFVPDWSPTHSKLYFESNHTNVDILVDSVSLQPFTDEQWRLQQDDRIRMKRMRGVVVHVTDVHGNKIENATVVVQQKSKQFPIGSAIAQTILGNNLYQKWFTTRFNAAVFENELKWYSTEPQRGKVDYSVADQMLAWCKANSITNVRGHNIFWEDPKFVPSWVTTLNKIELQKAVDERIKSVVSRYAGKFINWDVSNEMLHFSFYEDRLGPQASEGFFLAAQKLDPRTPMFMNDYNVIETNQDPKSSVDAYIARLLQIKKSGRVIEGIGLEGHFSKPNIPYMRAVLDKLGTLRLPIWLTEVDVASNFDHNTQAIYLEQILREGYSHPAVNGIMMWTALHPNGCYRMCLTDNNFKNLPTGDTVDKLLREWGINVQGQTDNQGSFKFYGFFGNYDVSTTFGSNRVTKTMSLSQGDGVVDGDGVGDVDEHVFIQI